MKSHSMCLWASVAFFPVYPDWKQEHSVAPKRVPWRKENYAIVRSEPIEMEKKGE